MKCIISQLMSYDQNAKYAQLSPNFYFDTGIINSPGSNPAFWSRRNLFLTAPQHKHPGTDEAEYLGNIIIHLIFVAFYAFS